MTRPETAAPEVRLKRLMSRDDAAYYAGVSPTKFDQLVTDGRMPRPARVDGRVLWDRRQLDAAIDALFDQQEEWNFQA